MKNLDRFVGLRSQDAKVYLCRVLMENGQPTEMADLVCNSCGAVPIDRVGPD